MTSKVVMVSRCPDEMAPLLFPHAELRENVLQQFFAGPGADDLFKVPACRLQVRQHKLFRRVSRLDQLLRRDQTCSCLLEQRNVTHVRNGGGIAERLLPGELSCDGPSQLVGASSRSSRNAHVHVRLSADGPREIG